LDFDPLRTLIGGPNEAGKSTLIEAVHRALFLKAKGNTEYHRALNSSLHAGYPEVDLTFESGGHTYVLKKRFGATGSTSLAPSNAVSLSGDAAESELARLLSVEAGISGKAIPVQWAHLWVWQGQAGNDPSEHATAQQNGLLQRLQHLGGAAALQSELDARVAKHFADIREQMFTQADKPKVGSELERSERASVSSQERLTNAKDRVQKLDSAATDLESASRTQAESSTILNGLATQQEDIEGKSRQLVELRHQEIEQSHAAKGAIARHDALEAASRQIVTTRKEISELGANLKPQTEAIEQLAKGTQEAKSEAAAAETAFRAASEAVRAARLRHDLALAHILQFEKNESHAKLDAKAKKISKCRTALAELEKQLAKLPNIDKTKLTKIQKLEGLYSNARSALQAMATGLEVINADKPVKAGGESIKLGERQILTEDTEVQIGSTVRLRIQPGGGTSLAEARKTEAETLKDLQDFLDSLGIQSTKEAVEAHAGRDEISSQIKASQAELDGMGAEDIAEELQTALNELTTATASVERLAAVASDVSAPENKANAKSSAKALEKKFSKAEELETESKNIYERAGKTLASAEKSLAETRQETEQQRDTLTGLNAQLELLLKTHGEDAVRSQALGECQTARESATQLLKGTTDTITSLQPELLDGDRARITRAIKEKTAEQNEAGKQIAVAKAALVSDGSEDPSTELATAEVKARSATDHRNSVLRQSQAVALLNQLFEEEQKNLSEQFTQPLADKISGYLQCVFGAGASVQVDLENNEFTGLRLSRPNSGGAPFAFNTLSGGAKEQTAAAVRLAMAEVLAGDYGGCLPVVFDDAFAYSDPERVNQLQRMLDLAATRGLQVIVLTCNSTDYASLGAKTIMLKSNQYISDINSPQVRETV
jgi:DNA repair exonuclease SbcCD ATPase subunit